MKEYKCAYCKKLIKVGDLAICVPKKDRKGNIKYLVDGINPQTHKYHDYCHEAKIKNKQEWDDLYEYIKNKYFNIAIPGRIFSGFREFGLNPNIIKGCLESIEDSLLPYIQKKQFKDDNQKAGYILGALKNNINTFNENYQKKLIQEKIKEESKIEVINTANQVSGEFKAPKSKNKFSFDFME